MKGLPLFRRKRGIQGGKQTVYGLGQSGHCFPGLPGGACGSRQSCIGYPGLLDEDIRAGSRRRCGGTGRAFGRGLHRSHSIERGVQNAALLACLLYTSRCV